MPRGLGVVSALFASAAPGFLVADGAELSEDLAASEGGAPGALAVFVGSGEVAAPGAVTVTETVGDTVLVTESPPPPAKPLLELAVWPAAGFSLPPSAEPERFFTTVVALRWKRRWVGGATGTCQRRSKMRCLRSARIL